MGLRVWRSCLCLLKMQHRKEICFTVSRYLLFPLTLAFSPSGKQLFVSGLSQWRRWVVQSTSPAGSETGPFVRKETGLWSLWFCASHCLFMLDALIKLLFHKQMARKGVFDVEIDSPDCSRFWMFLWKSMYQRFLFSAPAVKFTHSDPETFHSRTSDVKCRPWEMARVCLVESAFVHQANPLFC